MDEHHPEFYLYNMSPKADECSDSTSFFLKLRYVTVIYSVSL